METGAKIASAFLLAVGIYAAYDIYKASKEERDQRNAMTPVLSFKNSSGNCGAFVVGLNVGFTAAHCISRDRAVLQSADKNGNTIIDTEGNIVGFGIGWSHTETDTPADQKAVVKILQDPYYRYIVSDIALVLTNSNMGETLGMFQIVSLNSLKWEATSVPDITQTGVKLMARRSHDSNMPDSLFMYSCNAYRKKGISHVLAHDCTRRPGMSGGPIVVDMGDGNYGAIASHHGAATRQFGTQSSLVEAFAEVVDKNLISFAPTLESMVSLCDRVIQNCDVVNDNGRRTLRITNP
jgi:hypothetical protein